MRVNEHGDAHRQVNKHTVNENTHSIRPKRQWCEVIQWALPGASTAKLQPAKGRSGPFFKADYRLQTGYQVIVWEYLHIHTLLCAQPHTHTLTHSQSEESNPGLSSCSPWNHRNVLIFHFLNNFPWIKCDWKCVQQPVMMPH